MANLGCGLVGAAVTLRSDPTSVVYDLSRHLQTANCDRRLNDVSEAEVRLDDCYNGPQILPWVHDLSLSWDGQWIWHGPIHTVEDNPDGTGTLTAFDIMAWMRFRRNRDAFDSVGAPVDVTTIFEFLVSNGFDQDVTVPYLISATATGITGERKYLTTQANYVYDLIDELTTTGIDWTVILNTILCGDVDISTTAIGVLNESHFLIKPVLTLAGREQANAVTVVGSGTGDGDNHLEAQAFDLGSQATYGLLDLIENESKIEDQISLDAAAQTRVDLRGDLPLIVGEMTLNDSAPFSHTDLVPGAVVSVSILGQHVSYAGNVRLQDVQFNGAGGRWVPTLHSIPVGTTS